MKPLYNKKLRNLAYQTALRQVSTPLFLCDENLYICMKSIGAEKSIKQPITGSNLEVYMDKNIKNQVLEMSSGWLCGTIFLNSAELEIIVYTGMLEGEKYYVFLSEEGRLFNFYKYIPNLNASLQILNNRIGDIIDELLHSETADAGKLDRNCTYMIRLNRYISVALKEFIEKNNYSSNNNENLLSVNVLLDCIFKLSKEILPAYGYNIQYDSRKSEILYSECSTSSLITLLCIFIFNSISLSQDGNVKISYMSRTAHRMIGIQLSTASKLGDTTYNGGLLELAELLRGKSSYPFVLELMISAEITKVLGWNIWFENIDGEFKLKVELPESTSDISKIQLRANSNEFDYAEMLIREFMIDIDRIENGCVYY